MRIVLAPDAFKGSLSQIEVAETMKHAIESTVQQAICIVKPMADGGEGTLAACRRGRSDMKLHTISVTGPRGEKRDVPVGCTEDGIAMIEIATIVGLDLVPENVREPGMMTTYGVGLLQALGATIQTTNGIAGSPLYGQDLATIERVDISTIDERIWRTKIMIASDVSNPLYGEDGATFVFAPQKGARVETLKSTDEQMKRYVRTIEGTTVSAEKTAKNQGAGAAGGLGFALLLLHGNMEQGAAVVGKMIQLDEAIQQADLVITGEGKTDAQTMSGKAPMYVATRGKKFSVPTILVSGKVEQADWLRSYFTETYSLVSEEVSVERAMKETKTILLETIQTIFRRMT